MRYAVIGAFLLLFIGCASLPEMPAMEGGTATRGPASGDASGKTTGTTMPIGPAASYMGDATSNATSAAYSPQRTLAGTGSLVTGFVQGITAEQRESIRDIVRERTKTDPVLLSIVAEMNAIHEAEEPDLDRLDALRVAYREAESAIMAELDAAGLTESLELGNLREIVVVGIIHSNVGHDEMAPTDAESETLRYILSNIIDSAKGNEGFDPGGER